MLTAHQQRQIEIIEKIENQIKNNCLQSSIVTPVGDFANDPRICLTSVHIPNNGLVNEVQQTLVNPLRNISSNHYYYEPSSIHMTIKNVRVINDPPHFTPSDITKVKQVFSQTIPQHKKFKVYFYRLLLFPLNLSLMGTTDPQLDNIILDLDQKLKNNGVPDDKQYVNSRYFFSNITLVRFLSPATENFKKTADNLSQNIHFLPYTVDSVTLLTGNAALKKRHIIGEYRLK